MDDELIRHIKSRVDHWNGGSFRERFSPGDKVLVASGALKDIEGIFQRYVSAHRRCMVLLDLMGRLASVELREPQLRGLDPGTGSLRLSKG